MCWPGRCSQRGSRVGRGCINSPGSAPGWFESTGALPNTNSWALHRPQRIAYGYRAQHICGPRMNTDPNARLRIYEALVAGEAPTTQEVEALLEDAAEGERAVDKLEQLEQGLAQMGYALVDVTTDDDDGELLELVWVDEDED